MTKSTMQFSGNRESRENGFFSHFRRCLVAFSLSSFSVLVIGSIVIYSLPNIYVAESKMEITSKDLFLEDPESDNVVGNQLARRFYSARNHILSHENIKSILINNKLFDDKVDAEELERRIIKFRKSTSLDFIQDETIDPISSKERLLRVGVEVKYENKSPELAFKITNDLTKMFLESSSSHISLRDNKKIKYLQMRMKRAETQVRAAEEELAEFKSENVMFLPELEPITLNRYNELKLELSHSENHLLILKQRESAVRSNLEAVSTDAYFYSTDGARVIGPAEKLGLLEAELANSAVKFSGNHPDVARLKKEVRQLRNIRDYAGTSGLEIDLSKIKRLLATLKDKFKASHPDMQRLNKRKLGLENLLAEAQVKQKPKASSVPNNPAYIRALAQLESVQAEYKKVVRRKNALKEEMETVKKQIQNFPIVQKQLVEKEWKRDQVFGKLDELRREYLQAEMARSMNDASLDHRFVLVESPKLPVKPSKTHKYLLTASLVMLALSVGAAVVFLKEALNDRIRGTQEKGEQSGMALTQQVSD